MNAFLSEIARLYHATPQVPQPHGHHHAPLMDASGHVRCAVLELARPADWKALEAVWYGVQADLALPAPAIAVNGADGYQLWFSWQQPLPADEAAGFVQLLCQRYLPTMDPQRLRCFPGPDPVFPPLVPALQGQGQGQAQGEQWSAFLAPDLAGVFADEPWLDRHPGQEAQAQLLGRLHSMRPQDFAQALQALQPAALPSPQAPTVPAAPASPLAHYPTETPAAFLQAVMADPAAPLALRVQAAAALLREATPPGG